MYVSTIDVSRNFSLVRLHLILLCIAIDLIDFFERANRYWQHFSLNNSLSTYFTFQFCKLKRQRDRKPINCWQKSPCMSIISLLRFILCLLMEASKSIENKKFFQHEQWKLCGKRRRKRVCLNIRSFYNQFTSQIH